MNRPWEYDLEVTLADLPRGWAVAAIGEGKPVAAPPPVLDEIKRLRAERDEARKSPTQARYVELEQARNNYESECRKLAAERDQARDACMSAATYISEVHRNGHGLDNGLVTMSTLRVVMGEDRWQALLKSKES